MLFGGSTQCRTKNEDGERNLFHQKLWKLFLYGRNKRKNKNKLVGKVQKINADSVDRISRMVFNCDLCLKIWIFFSMKETRGKRPNLLERCKKNWWKLCWPDFTHGVQLWSLFMIKHDLWSFGVYFYQGQVLCSSVSINYFVVGLG